MRALAIGAGLVLAAGPVAAQCDADNAGLALAPGFCAQLVADGMGRARHMAVAPNGDLAVAVPAGRGTEALAGVWMLRDTDGDGRADRRERVVETPDAQDVELVVRGNTGWLYYGTTSAIIRHAWTPGQLAVGAADTIVSGMTDRRSHAAKTFVIGDGMLYVNIGAPSNSCQEQERQERSPGIDPCPILADAGGIWRFDANRSGQRQADGTQFATGMRNMVALAWHDGALYGLQHGRDNLAQNWGYSDEDSAELPAEEFFRIQAGDDFGWPYCYYDHRRGQKVLAPEYGGDGERAGRCADKKNPMVAYPGHWAPNGVTFYTGTSFPAAYRGGAFIAFHGSWNRAPLPQEGYFVVFQPFANGRPAGPHQTVADGFRPNSRPNDILMAPDGSLVVSDDRGGRIFRIRYRGEN